MSGWAKSATICLLLLCATAAIFARAISFPFLNWDDQDAIVNNASLRDPPGKFLPQCWLAPRAGLYVPLTYSLWYALAALTRDQAAPAPPQPAPFHALNVALHLANVGMVFLLLRLLPGIRLPAAAIGAAIFAIHPIIVEPVAWASTMYSSLHSLLGVTAIVFYVARLRLIAPIRPEVAGLMTAKGSRVGGSPLRAPSSPHEGRSYRATLLLLAATGCFILSMLAKPFGVVMPVLAAVIEMGWFGRKFRSVWPMLAIGLLLAFPIVLLNHLAQPALMVAAPVWSRPLVALDSITVYAAHILWPVHLIPDYGRSPGWLLEHPLYLATTIASAALLFLGWRLRHRQPWFWVAIAWFIVALLPSSGIMPFDYQRYSTVADRYAYLAMVGVAILVAGGLSKWRSRGTASAAVVVVVLLGVDTIGLLGQWRDTQTLFNHTLSVNPTSLAAKRVLGAVAVTDGNDQLAAAYFWAVLQSFPNDDWTLFNFANLLLRDGRYRDAAELYRKALWVGLDDAKVWNNLAIALEQLGDAAGARVAYRNALTHDADFAPANMNLDRLLRKLGKEKEAEPYGNWLTRHNLTPATSPTNTAAHAQDVPR